MNSNEETVYLDVEEVLGEDVKVSIDTTRDTPAPKCGSKFKQIKQKSQMTHGQISTIEPTKEYSLVEKERKIIHD